MKTALATFLLAVILLTGCSSEVDPAYIKARKWVYESGYMAGEAMGLDFTNGSAELKGDTIYLEGAAVGTVTKLYKTDNMMMIKSLKGEEGKYLDAVEYTR